MAVALFLTSIVAARAQTALLPSTPGGFSFTGTGLATETVVNVTPPAGATFTQACDVNVTTQDAGHDVTIGAMTSQSVAQGDALVATLWYRRTDTVADESNLSLICDGPSTNSRALAIPLRGRMQWRKVNIPFIAAVTGIQHFYIEIGAAVQEVQLGGMQLTNFKQCSVLTSTPNVIDCTSQFSLSNIGGTWGSKSSVAVTGNAFFSTAAQVNVTTAPGGSDDWECALEANLAQPVVAGHTLVAIFWLARDPGSNQSNMAISGTKFQQTTSPYTQVNSFDPLIVDGTWKQFSIPMTATASYPGNGSQFQIWCGAAVQKLDIGGIQIIDLGTTVTPASLTNNETDYPGRSITDPWRTAAQTRITQNRMGNLTVNVQNAAGAAISGVTVAAAMQKHHFGFATTSYWRNLIGDANATPPVTANPTYQSYLSAYSGKGLFNKYNDSDYKWPSWENGYLTINNNVQTWIRGHGITSVHGHNLIWPNYRLVNPPPTDPNVDKYIDVPPEVPGMSGPTLATYVQQHISSEVGDPTVRGFVDDWDVINEPGSSIDIQDSILYLSPPTYATISQNANVVTPWFTQTALSDPAACLYVNDSGAENDSTHLNPTIENFDFSFLTALIADNAPVAGLGFESHFGTTATPPLTLQTIFERFANITTSANKKLIEEVTEYDNQFTDPSLQADYLSDYLTMVFSEGQFDQFCFWGFWGGDFPSAVTVNGHAYGNIFDDQWNVVPAGEAFEALVFNKWWTNTSAAANASGVATINGFLGRYALTASSGGITKTYYADLPTTAGATVNLKLAGSSGSTHVWLYEAENAESIYAPLAVGSDPNALGGAYLSSAAGAVDNTGTTAPQARINMPDVSGAVSIWVRVIAPNPQSDSFFAQIDSNAWQILSVPDGTTWHWYKWTTANLAAGTAHVLNLRFREATCELDQVLVTDDANFTP